jgi:hypothetical protein
MWTRSLSTRLPSLYMGVETRSFSLRCYSPVSHRRKCGIRGLWAVGTNFANCCPDPSRNFYKTGSSGQYYHVHHVPSGACVIHTRRCSLDEHTEEPS